MFRGDVEKVQSALQEEGADKVVRVGTALGSITVDCESVSETKWQTMRWERCSSK